ncbi:MAG: CinA family protein [Gammaproteobacteria bacterium]|nr:CinA family protein [Gammaproteobacteria bacterium]
MAELLRANDQMLAVAESCTGGWLAKVCTDLPGSSEWFERGFVTYSNEAKQDMLSVLNTTIETQGAVSQQTVEQMASGVLSHSRAHWAIAISGVAGPGGGSDTNPVGSVWFAWMKKNQNPITIKQIFSGTREQVRQQSVEFALAELAKLLK